MKKVLYRIVALFFAFGILLTDFNLGIISNNSVMEVQAATSKVTKKELKKKYTKWLKKHGYDHMNDDSDFTKAGIQYVDIDNNGIIEMIYSSYALEHVVLTYDKKNKKVKKLFAATNGRGGFAWYNKSKHMIALSNSTTGDSNVYFYKVSSNKLKKKKVFKFYREDEKVGTGFRRTYKYSINGKLVNEKKYSESLKNALKGYKKVTPY